MEAHGHEKGELDFLIEEKNVSVTEFRRKPSAVWEYLETAGHVVFFTRWGKRLCALMSIETHACLSGNYDAVMVEVTSAVEAYRKERQRIRKRKANHE